MKRLLALARLIDAFTDRFATVAWWAILAACAISTTNAVVRYTLDYSSNGFLEIQWYLFAVCVMFGAAQVLRVNEHVRVDIFYGMYPTRIKVLIDLMGLCFFLLPMTLFIAYSSLPVLLKMIASQEMSSNAGGLVRWPAMLTIPLGMCLVALQGVAEIIKRVGWLMHVHDMDTHYERPLQ
ncbi:TRAP transporter small permease subunit [Hydrogenophaga sp. SL48]|jgi:TRAP-type mannitol/chloroaromatic compound transport system permease small subunit|uniref:TRAP transporter small permease subunit n=1 Tax=Hydrogenophaga sp. SL48 TaxID=2806347 RepID=UPI001F20C480|nr:TRAP transporter small permease subunit [Hydrogenophaga sp. SL48]UJW83405.1 TRAP transporter small permease subunit [Hydrogenophaga sp. SL48]